MNALPPSELEALNGALEAFSAVRRAEPRDQQGQAGYVESLTQAALTFATLYDSTRLRLQEFERSDRVSARSIIVQVCQERSLTVAAMLARRKDKVLVTARWEVMGRMLDAGFSRTEIARTLNLDHTSVLHGLRQSGRVELRDANQKRSGRVWAPPWDDREREVAAQYAAGRISKDEAVAALPRRSEPALLHFVYFYQLRKEPRP